jgi:hypothetical protein
VFEQHDGLGTVANNALILPRDLFSSGSNDAADDDADDASHMQGVVDHDTQFDNPPLGANSHMRVTSNSIIGNHSPGTLMSHITAHDYGSDMTNFQELMFGHMPVTISPFFSRLENLAEPHRQQILTHIQAICSIMEPSAEPLAPEPIDHSDSMDFEQSTPVPVSSTEGSSDPDQKAKELMEEFNATLVSHGPTLYSITQYIKRWQAISDVNEMVSAVSELSEVLENSPPGAPALSPQLRLLQLGIFTHTLTNTTDNSKKKRKKGETNPQIVQLLERLKKLKGPKLDDPYKQTTLEAYRDYTKIWIKYPRLLQVPKVTRSMMQKSQGRLRKYLEADDWKWTGGNEVSIWLGQFENEFDGFLPLYQSKFRHHGYDTLDKMADITPQELKDEFGVEKLAHRKLLIKAIASLQKG